MRYTDVVEPQEAPDQGREHRILVGRDELVHRAADALRDGGTPLVVVLGPPGAGISTTLDAVAAHLPAEQVRRVRLDRQDGAVPFAALYRMLAELGPREHDKNAEEHAALLGAVAKLGSGDPPSAAELNQVGAAVAGQLQAAGPLFVLLDGAHWLDRGTAHLLAELVRYCAECRVLAGVTAGRSDAAADLLHTLSARGMATRLVLRPLNRAQGAELVAALTGGTPDDDVCTELLAASAGNVSALRTAVLDGLAEGTVRVVDHHVYRHRGTPVPIVAPEHPALAIARDGESRWLVARTMAVLCPLGEPALALAADWLDLPVDRVRAELAALCAGRVLLRGRHGWRFRIPMVRAAAERELGPYARQRLAAIAVEAIWHGDAAAGDTYYLPDQLAAAGRLVDAERSAKELLSRGATIMVSDGEHAVRWLGTVPELIADPGERAVALLLVASACAIHDRMAEAAHYSREALRGFAGHVPAELMQSLHSVYISALAGSDELYDELAEFVARRPAYTDDPAIQLVSRAFAMFLLGQWRDGYELLEAEQDVWRAGGPTTVDFGEVFLTGAGVVLGELAPLWRMLRLREDWRTQEASHRMEFTRNEVSMLLHLGELPAAEEVLARTGLPKDQLRDANLAVLCHLRGDWNAGVDSTRRAIAQDTYAARTLSPITMVKTGMETLLGTGWVDRARRLGTTGEGYQLAYCLAPTEAELLVALGRADEALALLRSRLESATTAGLALWTESLWGALGRMAHEHGDPDTARECLARCAELAERLGTGRARMEHLLTLTTLAAGTAQGGAAGTAAVRLARERAIPLETANALIVAGVHGGETKPRLREAYDILGGLDALLWRARLRRTMQSAGVPVPDRAATVTENERLLAVLVTEGLRNRELAAVFGVSEKSIEGKLTRLFSRGGYQSRVELAAAVLSGGFDG